MNHNERSHHRTCFYFDQGLCRSCELMGKSIEDTLSRKSAKLHKLFPETPLKEFVSLEDFKGSRQKAKLAIFPQENSVGLGIYDLHKTIDLSQCPLYSEQFQKLIAQIKNFLVACQIPAYSIKQRTGEGKFVIINESLELDSSNRYMIRLVLRSKESVDRIKKQLPNFLQQNPAVDVVSVNIQPLPAAILEGEEEIILTDKKYFNNRVGEISLNLAVKSFSQINSRVAHHLYQYVADTLKSHQIQSLFDLYCGVGGFSFFAQKFLKKSVGVEISKEAISAALKTKAELQTNHLEFFAEDAGEFLSQMSEVPDAVIVNPPRNGLNHQTIDLLLKNPFKLLVYSSCNPDTLKRDHQELSKEYELLSLKPFDLFMMTEHFEVVAVYQRKAFLAASK